MQRGDQILTERAVLRPFSSSDVDALHAIFLNAAIRRYLLDDNLVSAEWMNDEIEASQARFDRSSAGLWSVRLQDEDSIIGFAGFREFFEPPQLQILYGLLPAYWGRGLATEVAAAVCEYGFRVLRFQQVVAAIDLPNVKSGNVLERLGMTLERSTQDGEAGTAFYVMRRAEWEGQTGKR